jgi:hypothetical protein
MGQHNWASSGVRLWDMRKNRGFSMEEYNLDVGKGLVEDSLNRSSIKSVI